MGTISKTVPSWIMSYIFTNFGDYWIKLNTSIKICIAYSTITIDPNMGPVRTQSSLDHYVDIQILVTIECVITALHDLDKG